MENASNRASQGLAVLLFSTVVTQIIYLTLSNAGAEINRMVIWSAEALAFMGITIVALSQIVHHARLSLGWAAIAAGGLLNVIQVGIGLAMFGPLEEAGEAIAPVFKAVLAGAFFLYFAGKFLFGLAAIIIAADLLRGAGAVKVIGALTAIAGLAAMVLNLGGMAMGMALVYPAGASGTLTTLLLGVGIAMLARQQSRPHRP
ncbi:hypothetical protein [Blastomonas sp.]|uniref:hypothetical protein n=1 Tax=Blastomonas sp. TaxID=1909299 RepID=UPI00359481BA